MNTSPWSPYTPVSIRSLEPRAGLDAPPPGRVSPRPGPSSSATSPTARPRPSTGSSRANAASKAFPPTSTRTADLLGDAAGGSSDARRLQAWWLYRALFTPDPLAERLTLAWHDHFATSQLKVDDVAAMRAQNETFGGSAAARSATCCVRCSATRPCSIWLDAPSNRKGKPNENLARELMELFTLGVGRYTEDDVKECAAGLDGSDGRSRAGFSYEHPTTTTARRPSSARPLGSTRIRSPTTFSPSRRRPTGSPGGSARRSWAKGWPTSPRKPASPNSSGATACTSGRAVETVLRSELFFSDENLHARVADPVGFVVGTVRALERFAPPPSTLLLAEWTARLGQELFYPPNVGGWPGGRGWLSGRRNRGPGQLRGRPRPGPA